MTEHFGYVDGLPNVCGDEDKVEEAIRAGRSEPVFTGDGRLRIDDIDSAFAIALHMHLSLIHI